jgi:hypothetical protein
MQSTFMKQVAYNQRIIAAEEEISGINCDVADFVSGMTLDPAEEMIICVNGSEEMKRNETAMAGRLWIQGDRKMTAANPPFDGMANTKEAAILSAVAEAVAWKNEALEAEDPPRKGQRVVIYPKDLVQLDAVLSTGDPNVDPESRHPIGYERILAHAQTFETPPIFIKADAERITSDPKLSELVPNWMCTDERIATGNRRRVPEDGPDTWYSDDEAKEDVLPDVEKGAYTAEMDPKLGPKKLSAHEAAQQRAAANALKSSRSGFTTSNSEVSSDFGYSIVSSQVSSPQPSRQPTPASTPVNSDDDEGMTEDLKRVVAHAKKCSAHNVPRCTSAPGTKPPPKKSVPQEPQGNGTPASRLRAEAGPSQMVPEPPKAAAPQRAPALKSKSKGDIGQESPGTKVPAHDSHPMASRAGGLRSGGGIGPTDTCVDLFNPSKT